MEGESSGSSFFLLLLLFTLPILLEGVRARRSGDGETPSLVFWVGASGWLFLALALHCCGLWPSVGAPWRWLLPALGMVALTATEWVFSELRGFLERQMQTEGAYKRAEEEPRLDPEDRRLGARLSEILSAPVGSVMTPMGSLVMLPESASAAEAARRLRREECSRIYLEPARGGGLRLVDAKLLVGSLKVGGPPEAPGSIAAFAEPMPSVSAQRPVAEALKVLRSSPSGAAAVTNGAGPMGVISWDGMLAALMRSRSLRGDGRQ